LFSIKPVDDCDIAVRFNLTVQALEDLGGQMREVSGRKNLVWATHGIPIYGYSIANQGRLDFTKPIRSLCEGLPQAQIAVYTVDQSMVGAAEGVGTTSVETLEEFTGTDIRAPAPAKPSHSPGRIRRIYLQEGI
jgi:hypothetical protein